jgi:hypothetical protein
VNGRVLKLVPCENCSTEYVYVLEREGTGVGTSVYALGGERAQSNAASAADESLREYLANDFDPVPCPVCGHYQRYMFPKLYEAKSLWVPAAKFVTLALGCLGAIGALYWSAAYLQQPSDRARGRLVVAWSLLAVLCLTGLGLAAIERSRARCFDPNSADQQARIQTEGSEPSRDSRRVRGVAAAGTWCRRSFMKGKAASNPVLHRPAARSGSGR